MTKTISFCVILLKFYFLNSVMRTVHTFSVPSAAFTTYLFVCVQSPGTPNVGASSIGMT